MPPSPPPPPANTLSGVQDSNVVLSNAYNYFISGVFGMLAGATLTIQPGVNVYFLPGASIIIKGGGLKVQGTASSPVTFAPVPGTDGSGVTALSFSSGFNYSTMVLQNVLWQSVGQSIVDVTSSGANVGLLSAANLTFVNTSATIWPPTTVLNLAVLNGAAVTLSQSLYASNITVNNALLTVNSRCYASSVTVTQAGTLTVPYDWSYLYNVAISAFSTLRLQNAQIFGASFIDATVIAQRNTWYGISTFLTGARVTRSSVSAADSMTLVSSAFVNSTLTSPTTTATGTTFTLDPVAGFAVQTGTFTGCTFSGTGLGLGLVVSTALTMTNSTISGADTVLTLQATSTSVQVSGSRLLSTLNPSSAAPPYVVNNLSPYTTYLSNNYWGSALQAVTGTNTQTGKPIYALNALVYDVFVNLNVGKATVLPFANASALPAPPPAMLSSGSSASVPQSGLSLWYDASGFNPATQSWTSKLNNNITATVSGNGMAALIDDGGTANNGASCGFNYVAGPSTATITFPELLSPAWATSTNFPVAFSVCSVSRYLGPDGITTNSRILQDTYVSFLSGAFVPCVILDRCAQFLIAASMPLRSLVRQCRRVLSRPVAGKLSEHWHCTP